MIKDIKLNSEAGAFLTYKTENVEGKIPYSAIAPYWDYAQEDEFEGGFAKAIDDDRILAVMLVAAGQGGAAVVWNAQTEALEHISDAAYCAAATNFDGCVYTLSIPSGFFTPTPAVIEKSKLGTKDVSMEPEKVKEIPSDILEDYDCNLDDIDLIVDDNGIKLILKGKKIDI